MHRPLLTALVLSTLTAPAAFATPPCERDIPLPRIDQGPGQTLLLSESLLAYGITSIALATELTAPDGAVVEWEILETEFAPDVVFAAPVGGWQPGEYLNAAGGARVTVVDEEDDVPPDLSGPSWRGWDANPFDINCSLAGQHGETSGASVTFPEAELPFVYSWERLDEDGAVADRGWGYADQSPSARVPAPAGSRNTFVFRVCDHSQNCADATVEEVVGCSGCSGAVGGRSAPMGLAVLLGVFGLALRVRRAR